MQKLVFILVDLGRRSMLTIFADKLVIVDALLSCWPGIPRDVRREANFIIAYCHLTPLLMSRDKATSTVSSRYRKNPLLVTAEPPTPAACWTHQLDRVREHANLDQAGENNKELSPSPFWTDQKQSLHS